MAKKKTSLSQTLFGQIDPYGTAYEEAATPPPSVSAATLPLASIRPDPDQPRQLLPPALSQALAAGQLTPVEALCTWLNQADGSSSMAAQRPIHELRRLAASIAQHGLINPITVRQPRADESLPIGVEYVIVTGERRYWSHIFLLIEGKMIQEGPEVIEPDRIKAMIVPTGISVRAHQLIENLLREDINALEKARGLWALRYELSGVNHGSPLNELTEEDKVNHSSPSVSNTTPALAPWTQVEAALNVSKRYRIFITSVLDLCDEAQHLVAEHNLGERVIRPIVQKLKGRPDLQIEALQQLIRWREAQDSESEPGQPITDATEALVAELLAHAEVKATTNKINSAKTPPLSRRSLGADQFRSRVQSALRFLNKLEEPDLIHLTQNLATTTQYAEVVEDLRDLRERIDAILEAVSIYNDQVERSPQLK